MQSGRTAKPKPLRVAAAAGTTTTTGTKRGIPLDDIDVNGRDPAQYDLEARWVATEQADTRPTGGVAAAAAATTTTPLSPHASLEGSHPSDEADDDAVAVELDRALANGGEEEEEAAAAAATAPEGAARAKRPRAKKVTVHLDCVNPARIAPDGTLLKPPPKTVVRGSKGATGAASAQPRRRERLSALSAQYMPPVEMPEWQTPDLRPPAESLGEAAGVAQGLDELADDLTNITEERLAATSEALSAQRAPHWLDTDAVSGLSTTPMAQHSAGGGGGSDVRMRTLDIHDFGARFSRQTVHGVLAKVAEIVGDLYSLSEARHAQRVGELEPAKRVDCSATLMARILAVPDYHERMMALLSPVFNGEHFSQAPLPSVPLMTLADLRTYCRPPDVTRGERPCKMGLHCMARCGQIPDLKVVGPLQWTPSNQRPKKHRDETQLYVLRELLLPAESLAFEHDGTLPHEQRYCVLCAINAVNTVYFDSLNQKMAERDWSKVDLTKPLESVMQMDVEYLTKRLGAQQLFQVVVAPNEFSEQAVLNVCVGGRVNAVRFPFPLYERLLTRWTEENGRPVLSLMVRNFL